MEEGDATQRGLTSTVCFSRGVATTSARLFRSFLTLRTRFKTGSSASLRFPSTSRAWRLMSALSRCAVLLLPPKASVLIDVRVQLGGTVGDIESAPFVEAMRQFQFRVGQDNFALIHVSLVPAINGELKTKPTQASIRDLRGLGLTPDLVRYSPSQLRTER